MSSDKIKSISEPSTISGLSDETIYLSQTPTNNNTTNMIYLSQEDLNAIIEKAKKERDIEKLQELHRRDKENPDAHRKRSMKYYLENKDAINAKRREAYKNKKQDNIHK